jgi:hypothetical protein
MDIRKDTKAIRRAIATKTVSTWYARAASEANGWFSVCWSPELSLFCAVANDGINRVMTTVV